VKVPEIGSVWIDPQGDLIEVTDIEVHYRLEGQPKSQSWEAWQAAAQFDADALHPFKHDLLPDLWLVQLAAPNIWRVWHPEVGKAVELAGAFADACDWCWAREREAGRGQN
jgi:hypothetical protein